MPHADYNNIHTCQVIHGLARQPYEHNRNTICHVQMTHQIANTAGVRLATTNAFNITLNVGEPTHAYGLRKFYASILRCCGDTCGWCNFMPFEYVREHEQDMAADFYA